MLLWLMSLSSAVWTQLACHLRFCSGGLCSARREPVCARDGFTLLPSGPSIVNQLRSNKSPLQINIGYLVFCDTNHIYIYIYMYTYTHIFCSYCLVAQSCPTLRDPMDCSTPGFPVLHCLQEPAQTHVHLVSDAIQPSHSLPSPSPALNLSQHQGLFQ